MRVVEKLSGAFRMLRDAPAYKKFGEIEPRLSVLIQGQNEGLAVDIGCGSRPKNPFRASSTIGVDFVARPETGVLGCDIVRQGLPLSDNEASFVTAFDFIEHLPRTVVGERTRFPFVDLMNEVWRILRPGGFFLSYTPAHPFAIAHTDPTHVNIITEATFPRYFCAPEVMAGVYGFQGNFSLVEQGWRNHHLITVLRKPRAD
jgi:SAM-dependent methyltransferase